MSRNAADSVAADSAVRESSNSRIDRARTVIGSVARLGAMAWSFTALWLLLYSVLPAISGWEPTLIRSGSMAPSIDTGAVVHIAEADPEAIGVGAVVMFDGPNGDGTTTTHRVVGLETEQGRVTGFRTKGDANATVDSDLVPVDAVQGVVRFVVPLAGVPANWLHGERYLLLAAYAVGSLTAFAVTLDTLRRFVAEQSGSQRQSGKGSKGAVVAAGVVGVALMATPTTSAAFSATTGNAGNTATFVMTTSYYVDSVDADGPIAHWRLGEGEFAFADNFESFGGWNAIGGGTLAYEGSILHTGYAAGRKRDNDDPSGAWKPFTTPVAGDATMSAWVYRPSGWTGGSGDRFGIEDASFNGYSVHLDHGGSTVKVERRDGGAPTVLASTPFDIPEDEWVRAVLRRSGTNVQAQLFDGSGTLLASVAATDSTTTSFDRFAVRGGYDYVLDDLLVAAGTSDPTVAVDRIGLIDGHYVGNPILGRPGLITNDPAADSAVEFNPYDNGLDLVRIGSAPALNQQDLDERSIEAWVRVDNTGQRSVIYEEGGFDAGTNIYSENGRIYASAWSRTNGWSNDLVTSMQIDTGVTYHVVAVLDAVGARTLTLYVDGVLIDTASKTDSQPLAAHDEDGSIGGLRSDTRFASGTASSGNSLWGIVDEVAIYNTALSQTRIQAHFSAAN